MKKIFAVLIMVVLLMSLSGCGAKQTSVTPSNPNPQPQTKIIKIDSDPQGATVYIDNNPPVTTPADVKLAVGWHYVEFRKDGYQSYVIKDFEVKEGATVIKAKLEKVPSGGTLGVVGNIAFDTVPHIACCSAAAIAYSNIFYGGTYTVSGVTSLNSFDIVFPSGKKVHFDTKVASVERRRFSKDVTFNEIGVYKVVSKSGQENAFEVCYKPTILSPTPQMNDIFVDGDKNAIAVPVGSEVDAKVLITDVKGNPIRNTALGVYGLKTDKDGIANFKAKVERKDSYAYEIYVNGKSAPVKAYANLLIFGYDYAKFTKDGTLVESTTKNVKATVQPALLPVFKSGKVIEENNHIYMPYGTFGTKIIEIYKGAGTGGDTIISHPKDPSVIYTNAFISKDGGNTFEKLGEKLDAIAVDPENPNIVLGWSRFEPKYILKSKDYGLHFEKLANVNINLVNNFVVQILIDPKNPKRVYVATWKGLYVSNDGADTFEPVNGQFGIVDSIAISTKDSNLLLVGCEKGIMRSEDSGKTWSITRKNPNVNFMKCIVFDLKNPDTIYANSMYDGLLASNDSGKTWQSLHRFDLEDPQSIAVNPLNSNIIYVASFRDGIYRSVDYGKTFEKLDFPVGSETGITFGSDGKLYVIDDGVPFTLSNSGKFVPLDGKRFLIGGPDWKIIDNELFIDISSIKTDGMRCKIGKDYIEFYKVCDMVP